MLLPRGALDNSRQRDREEFMVLIPQSELQRGVEKW